MISKVGHIFLIEIDKYNHCFPKTELLISAFTYQ